MDSTAGYKALSNIISSETSYWSGGYEKHHCFPRILAMGADALPLLLADLADSKCKSIWWRVQVIVEVCNSCGIDLPVLQEHEQGHHHLVKAAFLKWGKANGNL